MLNKYKLNTLPFLLHLLGAIVGLYKPFAESHKVSRQQTSEVSKKSVNSSISMLI